MNETLSIKDVIKNSVLANFDSAVTASTVTGIIFRLLISLAVGIIIYLLYKASYRGVVYSESFAISLIGITVISSGILLAISSNVVLSLGCVGALSIVRYRTAIKSPLDLMFLFLCVGVGICVGAGILYLAIILVIIIALMLLIMSQVGLRDELYVLIIHYTGADARKEIETALGKNRYKIQSQTLRKTDVEVAVEVRVKNHNLNFTNRIRKIENVTDLTLIQYNGDYIG